MDDCMRIVQELLTGKPVDHDGEFFRFEGAQIAAAPTEPVPMIVGGRSEAALQRAGRLGDGWISVFVSATRYAKAIRQMEDAADAADRDAPPWRNGINIWCGVGSNAEEARSYVAADMETFYQLPYESFERYSPAGTAEQLAEHLIPYAEAGCSIFNLMMVGAGVEAEVAAVAEIRDRIVAAMA